MIRRILNTASAITFAIFTALFAPPAHSQASPFVVTNTLDSGPGSLRAAIQAGYLIDGCLTTPPVITFSIAGSGPHTISPQTELPALNCGSIDGYFNVTGATPNTDAGGSNNASIRVILNGSGCLGCDGLKMTGTNITVKGLAIHSFQGAGIRVNTSGYVFINGNYIGTDPGGMTAYPNQGWGVSVDSGYAYIGYADLADRNLITGNSPGGVKVAAPPLAAMLKIAGGISLYNAQIGGARDGSPGIGNSGAGVYFELATGSNSIVDSHVRHNSGAGIVVASGGRVAIRSSVTGNSIHSNGGPGIDLGNDGATANDDAAAPYDTDGRPNYPNILSVVHSGGNTIINAEVKTAPVGRNIVFEFYANDLMPSTPSGKEFLGSVSAPVTTTQDPNGKATAQFTVPGKLLSFITATASHDECNDFCLNTSEFSPAAIAGVALSGTSLSFGSQTLNTSSGTQPITVTNSGTAPLGITAINIAGDFGFTGCATPLTLLPGASCTLAVYFFPTATGSLMGSVAIVSNAAGSPHVISLSGTGTPRPVPGIVLAPSSANFGTILVGQSATQVLALSNPGTANLDIGAISVIEFPPPPAAMRAKVISFSQTNDCPPALAPSAACNITVTYTPGAAGSHAGELRVVSNAAPSPLVAPLSGSANPATTAGLRLSASSVTFAPQFPGTTSVAQSVTLTSSGTAPLVITQVAASGDFSFSGCGPSTLAPGATCSFAITFKPFSEGPHSGAIVITSNAPGSPHTLSLGGTGSPRLAPEISLAPSDFAFGAVRTQRTVTLTSRLTNAGAAVLEISRISSVGPFFSQSNNCPASLSIAAFCDITVSYAPTATGPHSGQLVIHSNALPSPYIAALSGTGINVPPPFLDVDASLDFGQHVTGVTVRRTLTLANTGGEPLTISQIALIGSGAFGLEGACATIAPERSCDITVTFTPMSLAPFAARLDIVSNHSGGVVQVSLTGAGTALPQPALELSVGALGFGTQGVGSTTASKNVRLTSVGAVAVQLNSIASSLPDFVVDANQCPALLAPQQSCDVGVAFKPVAPGGRQGSLVIQSNAVTEGGQPHSVSLIGVGCRFFTVGGSRNPQRLCAP